MNRCIVSFGTITAGRIFLRQFQFHEQDSINFFELNFLSSRFLLAGLLMGEESVNEVSVNEYQPVSLISYLGICFLKYNAPMLST